jgi:phosphoribosyl 1,2-cyclic phosphate phosphodiesterase
MSKMKIKIIGSGGCVSTPKPCCSCKVCRQAREKGFPYARTGCSLFIEDGKVLIDTPEDINYALNHANIDQVNYVLYSHMDPDHTMGMRLFEQLKMDWLKSSIGIKCNDPVNVISLKAVMEDLKMQGTKYGSALVYYASCGLITLQEENNLKIDNVCIEIVPANVEESVAIFIITEDDKKVIYAPCDVKPFPENDKFQNADTLIIGNTIIGDILKNGFVLEQGNPLRDELFVMDEIVALKEKYHIKKVIITHIEEDWGKSYDDYLELQNEYNGIYFAYDGMEVSL